MQKHPYIQLFITFFKIGATTFGGGYAMLPIIRREVVERHGWIPDEEFVDVLAVSQSLPGAVAVNSSVFIGTKLYGIPGAIIALLGSVLPSFLIILLIAAFFARFTEVPVVVAAFAGIRPAIAALIAAAVVKLGRPALKKSQSYIFAFFFLILSTGFGVHPIYIILLGVMTGITVAALEKRNEKDGEAS
ncbi:MAG: chromate transporter [Bacillota bacterium]|nr:chromate transporter [Bacillota bacterium]MDW7684535.1 chromate transporter [Bacillota bacterium]